MITRSSVPSRTQEWTALLRQWTSRTTHTSGNLSRNQGRYQEHNSTPIFRSSVTLRANTAPDHVQQPRARLGSKSSVFRRKASQERYNASAAARAPVSPGTRPKHVWVEERHGNREQERIVPCGVEIFSIRIKACFGLHVGERTARETLALAYFPGPLSDEDCTFNCS